MKMTTMITMIVMTNLPQCQYASTSAFGYEDEDIDEDEDDDQD